ncbi:VOC family protein [Nocardioides daejeonensis]|uniref:VOC family protein n=1 Tax=Nocardioides daejeonensis TaxID=1046556 RepID=UPI000D744108|nr:VOC family protein [Nocardioides daejeonensis]
MASTHHAFDYIELPVDGMAAARAFYADAFGWTFNDYGPGYTGIRAVAGDGEMGGLNGMSGGGAGGPGPLVLLYTDDLDATASAVQAAGGSIVDPPAEFPGGRRFTFTDPSGNQLGVWATS